MEVILTEITESVSQHQLKQLEAVKLTSNQAYNEWVHNDLPSSSPDMSGVP